MRRGWTQRGALVLALIATSCGARLTDEQKAALQPASSSVPGAVPAGPALPGPQPAPMASTPGEPAPPAAPGGAAPPATGPSVAPAPPAPVSSAAAAAACVPAGGRSDVGVSETEVRIASISTLSGPVPGFGKTGQNGVRAYVNYVKSLGGVCGRQLNLVTADDRLDAGVNRGETERLSREAFALVGGTSPTDDGGAAALAGTNVPDVSFAVSESRIASPNNFSPNPVDPACKCNGVVEILRHVVGAYGVSRAAIVYPAQTAARTRGLAYRNDLTAAGLETVATYEAPITGATYAGFVNDMRDKKVDLVITTLELNGMADLAKAFQTAGYQPTVRLYGAQSYGRQFLALAGPAAEGTIVGLTHSLLEDRATNPAVDTFITWYERTNPGADIDFFAFLGWASADLFTTALRAAGPAPTRDAVLGQLRTLTAWDAGGLLSPRNPAGKQRPPCFLIASVKAGRWQRTTPSKGFQC